MFCLIFWINAWGSLIFDIEMIMFDGVFLSIPSSVRLVFAKK